MSWRVAAELVRRHPARLRVIETHPGGGQYDCLTIIDREANDGGCITLNRVGGVHVLRRFDDPRVVQPYDRYHDFWGAYLEASPRKVLRALERRAGLPDVSSVPATTPSTLSIRFAAACVAPTAFGIRRWEWRNGFEDTSGWVGGPREELFTAFPIIAARRAIRDDDDPLAPEHRFWFLLRDDEPITAMEATGTAWTREGRRVALIEAYRSAGRRLLPVVDEVLGAEAE